MRFSEVYTIGRSESDDWFDPILTVDTPLFIDPFLVYANEIGPFEGSHVEIITFFNHIFAHVAAAKGDPGTLGFQRALDMLQFPEVGEVCLGYT